MIDARAKTHQKYVLKVVCMKGGGIKKENNIHLKVFTRWHNRVLLLVKPRVFARGDEGKKDRELF